MNAESPATGAIDTKIYQDEPIRHAAARLAAAVPPEYREMRRIAYGSAGYLSDVVIFCRQGKFMENFEDDFVFDGDFSKYYPTYQDMDDRQLRGYFSWRTRIRRGEIAAAPLSFAFVHIYELLNLIGVKNPEDGFRTLKDFWLRHREIAPGIDRYCKLWLKDYAVYYGLDRALLADVSSVCFDREVLAMQNPENCGPEELFEALEAVSPYKLSESRFFKLYPEDVRGVVCAAYAALADHHRRKCKSGLCESLLGKLHSRPYRMFTSAVFYDRRGRTNSLYEINDFHKYRCLNGEWTCEKFLCYRDKVKRLGALLKNIDFLMRRSYGFSSALKPEKLTKLHAALIEAEIERLLAARRQSARTKIEIDLSKLGGIRQSALETQSKLIVEAEAEAPSAASAVPEPAAAPNGCELGGVELAFLRLLLRGGDYEGYAKANRLMTSVLVDSINAKLFDRFGDTPIVCEDDNPKLLEDYLDELKGIIGA